VDSEFASRVGSEPASANLFLDLRDKQVPSMKLPRRLTVSLSLAIAEAPTVLSRNTMHSFGSSALLYHLLLFIQHAPIDTLDVLAKRCSSWRQGTKFESVFAEMQNKIQMNSAKNLEEFRADRRNSDLFRVNSDLFG
jgi:hypothetical protein